MNRPATVISFASSKGGAGKTTAAIVIAEQLARDGHRVVLIDADPNAHLVEWQRRGGTVEVVGGVTETNIIETIAEQGRAGGFVLVDLEGTASNAVTFAASQSDLVLIPAQASAPDLREAIRGVELLARVSAVAKRPIKHRVLLSKTPVLATRTATHARNELARLGAVALETELLERVAFKEMTFTGQTPGQVDPNSAAARNVAALTEEVLAALADKE